MMLLAFFMIGFTASEDDVVSGDDNTSTSDIPKDEVAGESPVIDSATTAIPNINYTLIKSGRDYIMRIDMTGVQNPQTKGWLELAGTATGNQNVWLTIDGKPKGIKVYNSDEDGNNKKPACDLVFLVDNSGSMGEEADVVARDIINWSQELAGKGLDMKFGCVGYGEGSITGGINLTDVNSLSEWLNHARNTSRTVSFAGPDANNLQSAAYNYRTPTYHECGGAALRFADKLFSFRSGANRVYVNFTDEPNQPAGKRDFSVEYFKNPLNWSTSKGTVHTVYSEKVDTASYINDILNNEKPWLLSQYTGGTTIITDRYFSGVSLSSLPVTGALTHYYIIRLTNIGDMIDDGKEHTMKITVLSKDGFSKAEKEFKVNFTTKELK